MKLAHCAVIAATCLIASRVAAQDDVPVPTRQVLFQAQADLVVKTVSLHHLTSAEAVKLLAPYVRSPAGGVFEAPSRAVTIRELRKNLNEILAVLAQYDREPASITLNFQLIAAENTNTRDPNLAGLDSLLRGVLKYSGYKLLTTAVASASEFDRVTQSLSADGEPLSLWVDIADVRTSASGNASVHLNVVLQGPVTPANGQTPGHGPTQLLSTGVTVPIGQTVVLGTSSTDGGQRALILTVRPQLTALRK